MHKHLQKLWATVPALCLCIWGMAQVVVKADRNHIYIGQPIRLHITMAGTQPDSVVLGKNIGAFDVLQQNAPVPANGQTTQTFIITCYDSGHYRLPDITTAIAGQKGQLADSIFVDKMPADSLRGYADVKTIFTGAPSRNWLPALLYGLAALLCAALLWWFIRKYFRSKKLKVKLPINNSDDWHREMKKLQQNWSSQKLDAKMAATELMVLIRSLLQLQGITNSAFTGEEMIQHATGLVPAPQHASLKRAVQICYQLMFANQQPQARAFSDTLAEVNEAATVLFASPSEKSAAK